MGCRTFAKSFSGPLCTRSEFLPLPQDQKKNVLVYLLKASHLCVFCKDAGSQIHKHSSSTPPFALLTDLCFSCLDQLRNLTWILVKALPNSSTLKIKVLQKRRDEIDMREASELPVVTDLEISVALAQQFIKTYWQQTVHSAYCLATISVDSEIKDKEYGSKLSAMRTEIVLNALMDAREAMNQLCEMMDRDCNRHATRNMGESWAVICLRCLQAHEAKRCTMVTWTPASRQSNSSCAYSRYSQDYREWYFSAAELWRRSKIKMIEWTS